MQGGVVEVATFLEEQHGNAEGMDEAALREHEEVTKVKNVNFIELGRYRMATWYFSPLPKEYWDEGITDTVRRIPYGRLESALLTNGSPSPHDSCTFTRRRYGSSSTGQTCSGMRASGLFDTHPGTRFIGTRGWRCLSWMAPRSQSFVRTYVTSPRCSWITSESVSLW